MVIAQHKKINASYCSHNVNLGNFLQPSFLLQTRKLNPSQAQIIISLFGIAFLSHQLHHQLPRVKGNLILTSFTWLLCSNGQTSSCLWANIKKLAGDFYVLCVYSGNVETVSLLRQLLLSSYLFRTLEILKVSKSS